MSRIIFWSLFIFKTFAVDLVSAKKCVTPYGEKATCVTIPECGVISSALYTLAPRAFQFAKDSQCGCDPGMVCCGSSSDKYYPQLINCVPAQPADLAFSFVSDSSICGLDSSTDRIKGGSSVKEGEFPWLAALEYQKKRTKVNAGIRCGGSIITNRFILTAAHCIEDVEFEIIKVWLGVSNISSDETCSNSNGNIQCTKSVKKLNVAHTITHEFYDSLNKFNDIGLLRLEADIQFTEYIRPICLPKSDSVSPKIGTVYTVAGWGITENESASDIKLKVQVPLRDKQICEDYLKKIHRNITSKHLCVGGERGKDACQGDSGGPLMYDFVGVNGDVQWFQMGIVSYGTGCGVQGKPGIYTNVTSYGVWIYNNIQNNVQYIADGEPCRTQNGSLGTCVNVNTCPEFFKRILTKSEYYNFTQYSQCDTAFSGLICCGNPSSTMITADLTTAPVLPDKTTCGIVNEELKIKDDEVNFPWIAGIEVAEENRTEIRCIGTVIHSRYIITSLLCVFGEETERFEPINVWLGRWNSPRYNANLIQKKRIQKIIPFALSAGTLQPNAQFFNALILLENVIQFSDYISPICLDSPNLPKLEHEDPLTGVWLNNSYKFEPIRIIKRKFTKLHRRSKWWEEEERLYSTDDCLNSELVAIPTMRRHQDQANGRKQWYLVAVDIIWDTSCDLVIYYPGILNSLKQITTIISEYS